MCPPVWCAIMFGAQRPKETHGYWPHRSGSVDLADDCRRIALLGGGARRQRAEHGSQASGCSSFPRTPSSTDADADARGGVPSAVAAPLSLPGVGFSARAIGNHLVMVVAFIAGAWALLMVFVLALCRAAARADTAADALRGEYRGRRSARRVRATYTDRARRPSLAGHGPAVRDPWFTRS